MFTKGNYSFSLFTEDNFTFLVMSDSDTKKDNALHFLENLSDTFFTDKPNEDE